MMRLVIFLVASLCAQHALAGRLLDFSFTSNQYGNLGSFTIYEDDLLAHMNSPFPGYLQNAWIRDLNFTFGGVTWSNTDIAINDYTIYEVAPQNHPLPIVVGGSGFLAWRPAGNEGGISIFNPLSGTSFKYPYQPILPGTWTTTVVVPEPSTSILLATGLLGFFGLMRLRRNDPFFRD
jgi:PEP-CTERM motif